MDEQAYINTIASQWPKDKEASVELLALAEEAISAFSQSAKLWCMRGDLIQISGLEANYELADAVASYQRAVAVNPLCGEAYESIGYYYDVIEEDLAVSETAFRKAVELKTGQNSHFGLARVLAEQGKREEALRVLAPENCPFHSEIEIDILRDEIAEGQWFHPEAETE